MAITFTSLVFICLLPITASAPVTAVSSLNDTAATMALENLATNKTSRTTSLQITETAATPTNPTSSMASTTEVPLTVITSTTVVRSRQTSNPTKPPTSALSSSTQSQGTGNVSSSQFPLTNSLQSTTLVSISTTSTKTTKVTCTSQVTGGGVVTHSTSLDKTSLTTSAQKSNKPSENKVTNHGKVVAALIGGALVVMMVGFLLIYIKKQKMQKQQVTTTDWAGPSPFLEHGGDSGQVSLRSSNRISLSSFLPQRLSKRLSRLPETDEELEDLTPGTTFGGKHQESSTFCQEVDGTGSNGTAAVDAEKTNTEDGVGTLENSETQINNSLSTKNSGEVSNLNQDNSETVENASTQNNKGLGQP
ncbi:mucin-3A-like [Parambassis ranga]|uniref:Mucin-3A-like n=1 Tax=Parambassis ranga TaxID=210632 RepID=A0A6P7JHV6_9TELE|nr:mucin-3A-like [Parambassis ranga]